MLEDVGVVNTLASPGYCSLLNYQQKFFFPELEQVEHSSPGHQVELVGMSACPCFSYVVDRRMDMANHYLLSPEDSRNGDFGFHWKCGDRVFGIQSFP